MKRLGLLVLPSLALAACADPSGPATAPTLAPSRTVVAARGNGISGSYIVVFRAGTDVDAESARLAARHGGTVTRTYHAALRGMAIDLPDAAATALANEPAVAYVEQDQVMSAVGTETNATWGLDRIDQHALPLNATYNYGATGAGVTVYIIDTGILFSHTEFGGRASTGYDAVTSGGSATDCNGHGTHVSGTVGGATYGVAKGVHLVAVRVLGCNGSGSTSGVIAGVDWVTANHTSPAAANMSLGGSLSSALDQAVASSIASGVTYGIAAGNGNFLGIAQDACSSSPADVASAITVSATDNTDTKASWANYGTCVDIFAPGVNITSAWYTSTTATNTISGTSMATPHVVGAAALYLETSPNATPAQVAGALTGNATSGVVKSGGSGTPNRLLYTAFIGGGSTGSPPVARFTANCTNLVCGFDGTTSTAATDATYAWDFGDGTTGGGATASHTYATTGTYSASLTVTDGNGTNTATKSVVVTNSTTPVARFSYSCSNRHCSFDASATTDATTYAWNFGDGASGSGVTTTHDYTANGNLVVTLTATGSGGSNAASKTIKCTGKGCA